MTNYEFKDRENNTYVRVTYRYAHKLYYSGHDIVLCPSNLRPFSMFNPQVIINDMCDKTIDFDTLVERFKIYNCTDRYTGRNVYYYVRKELIND